MGEEFVIFYLNKIYLIKKKIQTLVKNLNFCRKIWYNIFVFININKKMSLNSLKNNLSITKQREHLLESNNDLIYWVYFLKKNNDDLVELVLLENVLTCYKNQFENLKWLKDCDNITILDLYELRKWNISELKWKYNIFDNPILLSNWVIEIIEITSKNLKVKQKCLVSTLRDDNAWFSKQRTSIAWRCIWNDLNLDLMREYIEESPFIWYDKDGNFALATVDNSNESKKILKNSINYFLKNKYLKKWNKNYEDVKKNFERVFKWIKYDELDKILNNIIKHNRIFTYNIEETMDLDSLKWDIKTIKLWNSKWKYFTYFDKENNTIEYRLIKTITWFNDWFRPLLEIRPSKLYLESENQKPKLTKIEHTTKDYYVPIIKYFGKKITEWLI